MQHNSPDPPNQEHDSFAALRQDFPKAAVAAKPNSQIPILSFAAFLPDVSVAGQSRRWSKPHQRPISVQTYNSWDRIYAMM
jgi:hypothetical protein